MEAPKECIGRSKGNMSLLEDQKMPWDSPERSKKKCLEEVGFVALKWEPFGILLIIRVVQNLGSFIKISVRGYSGYK